MGDGLAETSTIGVKSKQASELLWMNTTTVASNRHDVISQMDNYRSGTYF